jgi:hypothetical protein
METLREKFFRRETPWRGAGSGERGWFAAPRTLPLILTLLARLKEVHKNQDVSMVYLELLSRQMGQGIVRIENERDHAYASGYTGERGVRTWLERMNILEDLGFIKSASRSGQRFGIVCLIHPTVAIHRLLEAGRIPQDRWWENWWATYEERKAETKEPSFEDVERAAEDEAEEDLESIS